MSKTPKTNAMRILDSKKIKYETLTYEVDESDLSGEHLAKENGLDVSSVYKTLVMKGDKTGFLVCCLPAAENVDLKKVARVSGNKSVEMLPVKDLLTITGYIRGGCSPIGMKKKFPTFINSTVLDKEKIYVSGGLRGIQLILSPADLISAADAKVEDLIF